MKETIKIALILSYNLILWSGIAYLITWNHWSCWTIFLGLIITVSTYKS